ncbi:hypothetical protein RTH46_12910 [Pseudomonas sp. zfem004]|uniref:hypothetical protein n=1 Tax=Pseudomonas sp. zfem004 TaxID=3078199 RepID=UPI002928EA10|nr:hypothetical protein [Pseudomonas sp. zfem004]MDU9403385.1 hypothetical protein [Pseudomonas sp. zfem004]
MSTSPVSIFGEPSRIWTVPPVDVKRQATASLRGYVYQLHASAAAWVDLGPDDELYLEVAEDYTELLRQEGTFDEVLRATQVKDTRESGAVTLNSPDVLHAIESLHRLRVCNPGREVKLVFLTTSKIGVERDRALASGVAGLLAWDAAASGGGVDQIRNALLQRSLSEQLRGFVVNSSDEKLRRELLSPLTFACGALDWRSLEEGNRRILAARRYEYQASAEMARRAYDAVFRDVIACVLGPAPRRINGLDFHACMESATSFPIPSAIAERLLGEGAKRSKADLQIGELRALAVLLIEAGMPPSIDLLFPTASAAAAGALAQTFAKEPVITEVVREKPASLTILELVKRSETKHLIIGQPGSGKTHALWQAAKRMLTDGPLVPLYLPAGQVAGWDELAEIVTDAVPGIELSALFKDPRVCVFIDGWSELSMSSQPGEKRKAMRTLRNVRLVATAKFHDIDDAAFKLWTLDLLSPEQVACALACSGLGEALPSGAVLDLLRLPLLLAIHILSEARSASTGDLLRQFHEHLMRGLPERFTEALSGAVAELSLAGQRSFGRLAHELQSRTALVGLTDSIRLLRSLGTILERSGQAVPVHDLYWSWLAGRGFLEAVVSERAINSLRTRASYALAIQAGGRAVEDDVNEAIQGDIVLAATLDASRGAERPAQALVDALTLALADPRLAVRNRAALAALECRAPEFLRPALDILGELGSSRLAPSEWRQALCPEALYSHRVTLAEWLGAPNSSLVLDVIAARGGAEWSLWLRQVASDGKISWEDAAVTALGCCHDVPQWVTPYLDTTIALHSWKLRNVAERRSNRPFARFVAENYESLIHRGSSWFHLNMILVSCGDHKLFGFLLERFSSMDERSQELLAFAVVERGSPWIARFQRIALMTNERHHHHLASQLSLEIDDETAREWIEAGHADTGWRVLVARYGEALLPELISRLPQSFAGLHQIPELTCMRYLPSAPKTLIDEIWRRLGSPMQPKAMEDVLNAVARVFPEGIPHIAKFIAKQPDALPAYHLLQAIELHADWKIRFGAGLGMKTSDGAEYPLSDWVAQYSATNNWEDGFTPALLVHSPELAIDFVLRYVDDGERLISILKLLRGASYNADLLNRMLVTPEMAKLIPDVFEGFDSFPVSALRRCIESEYIDQSKFLYRLAATANPMHRPVHEELLAKMLINSPRPHEMQYFAGMFKAYSREEVLQIIEAAPCLLEDCWFWFVHLVEVARGERLIDEDGARRR